MKVLERNRFNSEQSSGSGGINRLRLSVHNIIIIRHQNTLYTRDHETGLIACSQFNFVGCDHKSRIRPPASTSRSSPAVRRIALPASCVRPE